MTERIDCVVVGAGVVGLAVARTLARRGREVIVLEAETAIGTGVSARNSEVIHAGIYYPKDSLKARLCVAGRELLYRYCEERGVAHRRLGKLIVAASEDQAGALRKIDAAARANGVSDLRRLDGNDIASLEPEVRAVAGLLSPSTGIVDSHGLMLALRGEAEERGAAIAFASPVTGGAIEDGGVSLAVGGTGEESARTLLSARLVVNCAGLGAQGVSRAIGLPAGTVPPLHYAKGNYFTLAGRPPFRHLVYPVPEEAGLGVHATIDLAGRVRFGPDVEWVERLDYAVDPARAGSFYAAIRRYWPGLADGALQPGYSGIRPKVQAPGQPAADFLIHGPREHGAAGYIALYGIESPGLTSCLAIAEHVATMAEAA